MNVTLQRPLCKYLTEGKLYRLATVQSLWVFEAETNEELLYKPSLGGTNPTTMVYMNRTRFPSVEGKWFNVSDICCMFIGSKFDESTAYFLYGMQLIGVRPVHNCFNDDQPKLSNIIAVD